MNVTEDNLWQYIVLFHETLKSTAEQFLPTEHRGSLLHISLLPAQITGYVSTQFGAGIEYRPADRTDINIVRGSIRIEDLFVQAPAKARLIGPMFLVQEGDSGFHSGGAYKLTIDGAFPFRLSGENAAFRFGDVAFKFGAWHRGVTYAEIFGNRTREFWSQTMAISRAKDEVLTALAQLKRAEERHISLPEYLTKFREKTVLLLGDYETAGMVRLKSIAASLSGRGYDPILIKDIPDLRGLDMTQKVAAIGSLARFVIVDDSTKSGHLVEVQLCRMHNWVTVLLRQGGRGASWMTAGASLTSNVILEQAYEEITFEEAIDVAVHWAEKKIVELGRKFDAVFPWRIKS